MRCSHVPRSPAIPRLWRGLFSCPPPATPAGRSVKDVPERFVKDVMEWTPAGRVQRQKRGASATEVRVYVAVNPPRSNHWMNTRCDAISPSICTQRCGPSLPISKERSVRLGLGQHRRLEPRGETITTVSAGGRFTLRVRLMWALSRLLPNNHHLGRVRFPAWPLPRAPSACRVQRGVQFGLQYGPYRMLLETMRPLAADY